MDTSLDEKEGNGVPKPQFVKPFNELFTPEEQFRAYAHLLVCIGELLTGKKPLLSIMGSDGRMYWTETTFSEHRVIWVGQDGQRSHQAEEVARLRTPDGLP